MKGIMTMLVLLLGTMDETKAAEPTAAKGLVEVDAAGGVDGFALRIDFWDTAFRTLWDTDFSSSRVPTCVVAGLKIRELLSWDAFFFPVTEKYGEMHLRIGKKTSHKDVAPTVQSSGPRRLPPVTE